MTARPTSPEQTLPLLGLHEETLLPGEERTFTVPALEPSLAKPLVGQQIAVVTVTSPIELPGLASGRTATVSEVVSVGAEGAVLRGLHRVRISSARGTGAPFTAAVKPLAPVAEKADAERIVTLSEAARAALAALADGAQPLVPLAPARLESALSELLRAVGTPEDLRATQESGVADALRALAKRLRSTRELTAASHTLEGATAESVKASTDPELMRRLWSQCVELMRRLDLYDPSPGSEENDVARLQRRLMQAGLPREAKETAKRELRLLRQMETKNHDYPTYVLHLEWMAKLPWHPDSLPPPDLDKVSAALEREHSGLGKVKTRILEYLAVRQLGGRAASTVLCIAGPPGVGKTTIARAVAGALGRRFARVALGGVHDESELRGHRLSYTAAQPGRIVQAMAHAGQATALLLLDEIDKLGTDTSRSPTGALLEILDPEQHVAFRDHYLGVPYDLSNVLFVCTANDVGRIHPILRDRLEIVELEGYTEREKVDIARGHLLPRLALDHALPSPLDLTDDLIAHVVSGYTREPGVRELNRQLAALHRDRALSAVRGAPVAPLDEGEIERVLGPVRFTRRVADPSVPAGLAYGLSVSGDGGRLLPIEALVTQGGSGLQITGRIGEVMQESARAVLTHLRHHAAELGIDPARLDGAVHVHLPEGAIPKEGPSAGVALYVALLSAVSGRKARADVAMTGEITLHGTVLPVGGIKAKVLAAERAGIRTVLVPEDNRADVPPGLQCTITFVRNLDQVASIALE